MLTAARPDTRDEALAVLAMGALQASRMGRGTTGESRKDLAFKAAAAIRAAVAVLAPTLAAGASDDVAAILGRYLSDAPEPEADSDAA
jgi:hypothetical protein